jgi:hypothetical protein
MDFYLSLSVPESGLSTITLVGRGVRYVYESYQLQGQILHLGVGGPCRRTGGMDFFFQQASF